MGTLIEYRKMPDRQAVYRLIIYSKAISEIDNQAITVNRLIATELVVFEPKHRTIKLEKCFVKALELLPEQPLIKDIDVLFNPMYKIDVMKMLSSAYKQKKFSLVWPGTYADGKLIYSEEGCLDYRVYEIKDYDIMYVI